MYMTAPKNDAAQITIGSKDEKVLQYNVNTPFNAALDKGVYSMGTDADGNKSFTYPTMAEPHVERYNMTDNTYRIYKDSTLVYSYEDAADALNSEGYVMIGGSGRSVVWLYSAEVTQMKTIDSAALSVQEVTADAESIYVTFNSAVDRVNNFAPVEVKADNAIVDTDCAVSGKTLIVTPKNGIISDAVYGITIGAGFGPSELLVTEKDYSKKFTVTIFENEKFDNAGLAENSTVRIDAESKQFTEGGVIFRNGTIGFDNKNLADAEDYTVKFDYKLYTASMNNSDKNYNSSVPNSLMWFNAPNYTTNIPQTGYYWYIKQDGVEPKVNENSSGTKLDYAKFTEGTTLFGDAYLEDDGSITIFDEGYQFVDNDYIFYDQDGDIVLESTRSPKLYEYKIEKTGRGASLYRDGNFVHSFSGTELAGAADRGYFGFKAQITEFVWIDNFQAYKFNEITGITCELDMDGKKVIVENYGDTPAEAKLVVCAYGNNNRMLKSFMSDVETFNPGVTEVPFVLEAEGALKYKAFLWNNMIDLIPYCKAAEFPN